MPVLRLACLTVLLVLLAASPAAATSTRCSTSGPYVCVETSSTPDQVSIATSASSTYVGYQADVLNQSKQTITHVAVADTPPEGSQLVAVTSTSGACTTAGGVARCELGALAAGARASVTVTVTGPSDPSVTGITDGVAVFYDEGPSDNPGNNGKPDTLSTTETTAVTAAQGFAQSLVPAGIGVALSTDPMGKNVASPDQPQVAAADIPPQIAALVAKLARTAGPFTCPEHFVCRGGDWIQASIPGAFDPPLRFTLRWDATLVPKQQSVKNFAVFYTPQLGDPVQVISRRCSSAQPATAELPCLYGVREEPDGDFTAVLIQDHNGYMR